MTNLVFVCPHCKYEKVVSLPEGIFSHATDQSIPLEDQSLWTERLIKTIGLKDYRGVKIHMGRMHKGLTQKYDQPTLRLT